MSIDHRRAASFAPGELKEYIRAGFDLGQHLSVYVETVHRLNDFGAVVSHAASGNSREGFDAEWRGLNISMVEGNMISRSELFDETDLDTALARFEQLGRPARRLENAASQVYEHFFTRFGVRDWAAMAAMYAEDSSTDDRRRVVGSGVLHGREANIANMRAVAEVATDDLISTTIATRGERLALSRVKSLAFQTEVLNVVEIDADQLIVAVVAFDADDLRAAFEEFDARYLAGEAADHSQTWSIIAGLYAGFNRQELPVTTPDWTFVDHRSLINIEEGDLPAFIRAGWDLTPDIRICMEAVHRLSDLGVVVTHTARAVSDEDLDVEWRMIDIFTVDGDLISRCEMFDEADLDTAFARFEQLSRPPERPANAASRAYEGFQACFAARDWDAMSDGSARNSDPCGPVGLSGRD